MDSGSNNKSFSFKKLPWLWIALCVVSAVIAFALLHKYGSDMPPASHVIDKSEREVKLYFTSVGGKLLSEEKGKIKKDTPEAELRSLIERLLKGPDTTLERTIPIGTLVRSIKIEEARALIDFSGDIKSKHWGGSTAELLTVYSIVNSVTDNFAAIKEVQILIEGERVDTLAGHIKIDGPLAKKADMVEG